MTATSHQPNRRDLLKWLSGIPFLPLGAMTTAALTGCNDSTDSTVVTPPVQVANFKNATFTAMAVPVALAERARTSVSSKLKINWDDASSREYQLGYKSFLKRVSRYRNMAVDKLLPVAILMPKANLSWIFQYQELCASTFQIAPMVHL